MATIDPRRMPGGGWSGWVLFGAVALMVVGAMNIVQGLTALLKDEVYLVRASQLLVATDWSAWGWALVAWGALLILIGLGLARARGWARWIAIVLVMVNLIAQFAFFSAYPLWCGVVIAIDTVVLFALTAAWPHAREGLRD